MLDPETGEPYPPGGYPARSMSLGPPRYWPDVPALLGRRPPAAPRPAPPLQPLQCYTELSVPAANTWGCFPRKKL